MGGAGGLVFVTTHSPDFLSGLKQISLYQMRDGAQRIAAHLDPTPK